MKAQSLADLVKAAVDARTHADPVVSHLISQVHRVNAESGELAAAINELDRRRPVMMGRLQGYHAEHSRLLSELGAKLAPKKSRKK